MVGYVHKDTETGCLVPVTTAGPVGGTVEKLEYGCNKNYALPLTENTAGEGYVGISCECPIYYNPATGNLTVDNITGNITNAEISECVCVTNTSSNVSYNIPLICGNEIYKSANSNITFSPGTGTLAIPGQNSSICVGEGTCCTLVRGRCVNTHTISAICVDTRNLGAGNMTAACSCISALSFGYCGGLSSCCAGWQPSWGNQTGTAIATWSDCTGGSLVLRRDNPSSGALSMVIDGTVYVDEGRYAVVHEGNIGSQTVGKALQACNTVSAGNEADLVYGNMGDNDQFRIRVGGGSNDGWAEIATADDGNEPIYVRQYTGVFTNLVRTACLLDGSGNTKFPGRVWSEDGFCAYKGGPSAGSNVAGFCMHSYTPGQGYDGGAYVGHCNANVSGWWGYATFGFYNAENDTLCRGICVGIDGALYGISANCLGFNGACYIPTADNIRYYLCSNHALRAVTSGCTLNLYDTWS